jgi:hypothetical protein
MISLCVSVLLWLISRFDFEKRQSNLNYAHFSDQKNRL